MAKNFKSFCKFCTVLVIVLLTSKGCAQRPSYAGSRPPNGLNQKDKYLPTTPPNTDIENRFGSADVSTITNKIPFGQPQRPPIGYPVVLPEPLFTPLLSNNLDTSVVFDDRFDSTSSNNSTTISSSAVLSSSTLSTTQRPGVPVDAHGDQMLIDRLNQLPIDKRPFWFINYQAIEAQRNATLPNLSGGQASTG